MSRARAGARMHLGLRVLVLSGVALGVAAEDVYGAARQAAPSLAVPTQQVPDTARIRRALQDAVARAPGRAAPYLELAAFELREERYARAESILRTGLGEAVRDPSAPMLRRGLVELLGSQGRWSDALTVLDHPVGPAGSGALGTGARTAAGAETDALDTDALEARLRVGHARELRAGGRVAEAERALRRATALDAGLREGWVELASLLTGVDRAADARATADLGLRHHPGDGELMLLRASTLEGREHVGEMVAALRTLRAARPGDTRLALSLAGYLAAAGDPGGAMAMHDTLLAVPTPEPEVFRHVGAFWLTVGQADSAVVHLERGVRVHERSLDLRALIARAHEELGSDGDAGAAYEQAVGTLEAVDPSRSAAWLRIRAARSYALAGRTADALAVVAAIDGGRTSLPATLLAVDLALDLGAADAARRIVQDGAPRWAGEPAFADARARTSLMAGDTMQATERYLALAGDGDPMALVALRRLRAGTAGAFGPDLLRGAVRSAIDRVARAEEGVASGGLGGPMGGGGPVGGFDPDGIIDGHDLMAEWARARLDADREVLQGVVEEMVFGTEWGPAELTRLRGVYPGSVHLAEVDARLALASGDPARAVAQIERLLRTQPGRAELHALHGEALEAAGDVERARSSYGRAFELAPGHAGSFGALTRMHRADGTLADLLDRVRRLRVLAPDDAGLVSREVEVLQRLGRLEEARALAMREGGTR